MFNLEQSIAEWRQQMLAAGIKIPVPLEELECHLREEIEQQIKSGLSAQQAFEIAANEIGRAPQLKREFKKIGATEMENIIKLAGVICVAVALFLPLCICLPVCFHLFSDRGLSLTTRVLSLPALALTMAATILCWKYNHQLLPVIRNQRLRRAVGLVCFVGCLLWIRFVLFHLPTGTDGNILPIVFLFGLEWTVIAILGSAGHGLEKAARTRTATVDS